MNERVRSKIGFTHENTYTVATNDSIMPDLLSVIDYSLNALKNKKKYTIRRICINYYPDGSMGALRHYHKGSHQLVISLGATRTLTIGKRKFAMSNGSSVIFGGLIHGVPKQSSVSTGRISIAVFLM